MTSLTCPTCHLENTNNDWVVFPYPKESFKTSQRILFCNRCHLGIADPMPTDEELDELYQKSSFWGNVVPRITEKNNPVEFALGRARWRLIEASMAGCQKDSITVLDIGAGRGCLGLAAHRISKKTIKYSAVEPDPLQHIAMKEAWQSEGALEALQVYLELEEVSDRYDVVALSHVLEHVKSPVDFLQKACTFLQKDGVLFIDIPNQDHLFKKSLFPHLLFFSKESLVFLLDKINLNVLTIDGWGRNREKSPMNGHIQTYLHFLHWIICIVKRFVPGKLQMWGFNWLLGLDHRDPNGTWIRTVCKQK